MTGSSSKKNTARSVEEYVDLIDQAIYETEELRMAAEYDMDSMGSTAAFVDELEKSLHDLKQSMVEGRYQFENKDLPFMEIVEHVSERYLPFKFMLRRINDTHRFGLDVED